MRLHYHVRDASGNPRVLAAPVSLSITSGTSTDTEVLAKSCSAFSTTTGVSTCQLDMGISAWFSTVRAFKNRAPPFSQSDIAFV